MATPGLIITIGGSIALVLGISISPSTVDVPPVSVTPPAVIEVVQEMPVVPISVPALRPTDPYAITPTLIEAVIEIESNGRALALGKAGERGLMQIMPDTWREQCLRTYGRELSFELAFNPEVNRKVGLAYLEYVRERLLLHRSEWQAPFHQLLLVGYNAGPNALQDVEFRTEQLPVEVKTYVKRGLGALARHEARARAASAPRDVLPVSLR